MSAPKPPPADAERTSADGGHEIVAEERALLERVTEALENAPPRRAPSQEPIVRELERIREQLVGGTDQSDEMALHQQWHRQSALLEQLRRSADTASVDPRSPYFAHLRLRENGKDRDLCLGRATHIGGGVRIVDWRNAPVSRIFYRYEQGDEYEESFAGREREGEVVARRTLGIRDGALERVEAPEGVFVRDSSSEGGWRRSHRERPRLGGGEAAAVRAHAIGRGDSRRLGTDAGGSRVRVDKHLPEITSLIDPEQFELITRPSSGFVVIRGAAGSGKTTVALHRIAYLAYDDPSIDSPDTLFAVFSPALQRYVGHVLPALGVSGVAIRTYREWASRQRQRHFPDLPQEVRDDAPEWIQRLKLHPALGVALQEHVRTHPGPSDVAQALDDWASVLTHRDLLRAVLDREAPGVFSPAEIDRAVDWSRRRNEELFAHLAGDEDVQAALQSEDDTLLLRAWQLRVGPLRGSDRRPLRHRHIAIDEVQDFSPVEVQVLLDTLDRQRSITLAGDTQQHVMQLSGFTSWSDFLGHLGVPGTSVDTLQISYRSTREIAVFARDLLGALREDDEPLVTTRDGPPVELFRFNDRGACVAFLADALKELMRNEPLASVAILTPSSEQSAAYASGLATSEVGPMRHVQHQEFTFAPGIEVTEIEQVKGLEFDYVVLVDVDSRAYPDDPAARRLLHVGATRAVHQLWITSVGTPSPVVREAEGGYRGADPSTT